MRHPLHEPVRVYPASHLLQPDFPCYPGDCPQRGNAHRRIFPCGAVRENRQQPKPDCPVSDEYGAPYNALSSEVRAAVSDLAALKFEVLKVIGEAYGNDQAYQL